MSFTSADFCPACVPHQPDQEPWVPPSRLWNVRTNTFLNNGNQPELCVKPKSRLNHKAYSYRKRTWKLRARTLDPFRPQKAARALAIICHLSLGLFHSSFSALGFLHSPGHRVKYGCLREKVGHTNRRSSPADPVWGFQSRESDWPAVGGWFEPCCQRWLGRRCHDQAPTGVSLVHAGSQRKGGFLSWADSPKSARPGTENL